MGQDWDHLSHETKINLSTGAMMRAAETIAGQAETLADEMELGRLADHGGPAALRLLAAVVRIATEGPPVTDRAASVHFVGHA